MRERLRFRTQAARTIKLGNGRAHQRPRCQSSGPAALAVVPSRQLRPLPSPRHWHRLWACAPTRQDGNLDGVIQSCKTARSYDQHTSQGAEPARAPLSRSLLAIGRNVSAEQRNIQQLIGIYDGNPSVQCVCKRVWARIARPSCTEPGVAEATDLHVILHDSEGTKHRYCCSHIAR